jgi:phosphotriesterase-related protein
VIDAAVQALKQVKIDCGVDTIIDGTPLNLGRNVPMLQEISRRSGVHIILSTGLYYTEDYFLRAKKPEFLAEFFIDECVNGVADTGVKPEFLKCATNDNGVTPLNKKSLETMAIVQRETNLPLFAHNYHALKTPYEQLKIFERYQVNLEKVIIGHSSDSNDIAYLEDFLRLGCFLGFDRIHADCLENAKTIRTLIERGWEDKLLFSHDWAVFIDSQNYTWEERREKVGMSEHNLTNVHKKLIPYLHELGVTQKQIDKALRDNPLKLMQHSRNS